MERGFLGNILNFKSRALTAALLTGVAVCVVALAPIINTVGASQKKSVDSAAPQVVFTNPAPITINSSGAGSPYPSNITVAAVTGTVSKVTVTLTNASHTWPDDVGVLLVGPTGVKVRLMTDVGGPNATTPPAGGPMSNVTLTFDDAAANFLPDGLNTPAVITTGTWKPTLGTDGTNDGGPHPANFPAPAPVSPYGLLLSAFNGVDPNGTWSLFVDDDSAGDSGSIAGGWSIDITTAGPPVVSQKPNVDMNGDGFSDFVVAREGATTSPSASGLTRLQGGVFSIRERRKIAAENRGKALAPTGTEIIWWTKTSVGSGITATSWGDYFDDLIVNGNFDSDTRDDFIIWRPTEDSSTTGFYWINSSNSTFNFDAFGQIGDDPTVLADYDGDGIDDRATFRCPLAAPGECFYFYRSSIAPETGFTYLPWGFGQEEDFFPCPGDYDGDQKTDVCIVRDNPDAPGIAQFILRRSSDNGVEFINWGAFSDLIIPGDFDDDGRSDFCVRRNEGGLYRYYILERDGGGTGASGISWGGTGDVDVPGDYDGDGAQDIAIWRPSDGNFWILQSSNGIRAESWGAATDYPVANWNVR